MYGISISKNVTSALLYVLLYSLELTQLFAHHKFVGIVDQTRVLVQYEVSVCVYMCVYVCVCVWTRLQC